MTFLGKPHAVRDTLHPSLFYDTLHGQFVVGFYPRAVTQESFFEADFGRHSIYA